MMKPLSVEGQSGALVTVSIVTWNSAKYITKCLEAVFSQEIDGIEVIVVDNSSVDGTLDLLKTYDHRIRLIALEINCGYAGGHNIGIRSSSAPFIACLNPDVFLTPGYLGELIAFLNANPNYGGAIGKILQYAEEAVDDPPRGAYSPRIDTMGLVIERSRHFVARRIGTIDSQANQDPVDVFGVDGMAPMYRRQMLEATVVEGEYFDEGFFAYCEDQDLSWRSRVMGWKFACVPAGVAHHVRTWKPADRRMRRSMDGTQRKNALRNHYSMIVKNDYLSLVLWYAPFIVTRGLFVLTYVLIFERGSLAAYKELIKALPSLVRKRRTIMSRAVLRASEIRKWHGTDHMPILK
jgi:GT2 family glycosyltransferase